MLKIKNGIALSNLKKYGFKYSKCIKCWVKTFKTEDKNSYFYDETDYYVDENRILQIDTDGTHTLDDTLYYLIKLGWVERVDE